MLLTINNLNTTFHSDQGSEQVLHNVSLQIPKGKTVALVGESGSGKSVTALSILDLLEKEAATISGKITFSGTDLLSLDENKMRAIRGNRIAMIFQEPMTSLNPVYTVGDQIKEALLLHQDSDKKEANQRAIELLRRTGIPDPHRRIHSYPHQLSGGQRQRAMIAMALACNPDLLIADEPTTALDVTIQAQIIRLLQTIQQESGMAILLITHDLNMVEKCADSVSIMQRGTIVEQGKTATVFKNPRHPYTMELLHSIPKGKPHHTACNDVLLDIQHIQCHFSLNEGFFRRKTGTIKAVDDVSFKVIRGTTFGIVGESGSGKSTLGLCLLRLQKCRGSIFYKNRNLSSLQKRDLRPLRRELQIVFQDPFSSLSPRLTVAEIIGEGLQVHGIGSSGKDRQKRIEAILEEVGLVANMSKRYPHEFSGGQRQRIAIARALILQPKLLILDEPTSALDMTIQAQIIELLRDIQHRYTMTYILITHDLRIIRTMANNVAVMQNGRIVETGRSETLFTAPKQSYTKKLLGAVFSS